MYLSYRQYNRQKEVEVVDNAPKKLPHFVDRQPLTESNGNSNDCICERPMTPLLCTNCKKTYFGRIARTCIKHPNVLYLQDLKSCFNCSNNSLMEIDDATLTKMNELRR